MRILQAPSQTLTLGNMLVNYSFCSYAEGLGKQGLSSKNGKCPHQVHALNPYSPVGGYTWGAMELLGGGGLGIDISHWGTGNVSQKLIV